MPLTNYPNQFSWGRFFGSEFGGHLAHEPQTQAFPVPFLESILNIFSSHTIVRTAINQLPYDYVFQCSVAERLVLLDLLVFCMYSQDEISNFFISIVL